VAAAATTTTLRPWTTAGTRAFESGGRIPFRRHFIFSYSFLSIKKGIY
jgi:hypothetical protein